MDLFGNFNDRSLNDMIGDLNKKLKQFGFEPIDFGMNYTSESGINVDGEWSKSTYVSEDGKTKIVTITRGFDDSSKKQSKISSNDLPFLEKELSKSIESQDFEYAVELRDKIKHLKSNEKVLKQFEKELELAIKEQNFEKCIDLRDKIKSIKTK